MNKKEEVLDIELTPYGKYLLARGKMKPVYYAFFDDNVMYDSEYGGVQEDQSAAKDRIKQTPQMQTQYKFTSETKTTQEVDFGNGDSPTSKKHFSLCPVFRRYWKPKPPGNFSYNVERRSL